LAFLETVDQTDLTVLKLTELNAAKNRGTGTQKYGPKTKNMDGLISYHIIPTTPLYAA
jgi:hypothetical protein